MLRELGTRGDIIKTMHKALQREGLGDARTASQYAMHGDKPRNRIVGQVLDKRLAGDELGDRIALTIDGVDGRVHHVELASISTETIGRGSVVALEPPPSEPRQADRNIVASSDGDGVYSPATMREQVRERLGDDKADAYVRSHIRRLEALRRAGIVERVHSEHWTIPADLPERGLAYDRQRHGPGPRVDQLSHLSLDRQVTHDGATWLDRTMFGGPHEAVDRHGYGADVRAAWDRRKQVLAERGYVDDLGDGKYRGSHDLIQRLEATEIERAGRKFAAERGVEWQAVKPGERVAGTLVGQAQLASGRFAMIDNGLGFQLVPWNDTLGTHLERHVEGIPMPGGGIDWTFGRQRGLGL